MKLTTTLLATSALVCTTGAALAEAHMADELTLVSWGGAYQTSQQRAYSEPYAENTGTTFIWMNDHAAAIAGWTWLLLMPFVFATKAWRWKSTMTKCWPLPPMARRRPKTSAT